MSSALSIPNSGLPARIPKTAIKQTAKKAAKKAAGHHHPKKHAGPGHDHKHDPQADLRRAYLHLARANSLLAIIPESSALGELKKLHALCKHLGELEGVPPKTIAESARALEHLCFVGLASSQPSSEHSVRKELRRDFDRHFQHDYEKQVEHLVEAEATVGQEDGKSPAMALLDLARHSLATAEKMLRKENWYLAHECLRATDASTKAIEQF